MSPDGTPTMTPTKLAALALIAPAALAAAPALADTAVLRPTDASYERINNPNGATSTFDPTSFTLNTSRFPRDGILRRGLLDYPLAAIPAGATVDSAVIQFQLQQFTSQFGGGETRNPFIQFYGFAGDGELGIFDGARPLDRLLGASGDLDSLSTVYTVALDAAYVQSLAGGSMGGSAGGATSLGVIADAGRDDLQAAFYSTEGSAFGGVAAPLLTVTFTPASAVPEPASAAAVAGVAGVLLVRRRRA